MAEEWRLTAELDGDPQDVERLVATVASRLPSGARLTRDGRTLRVYSEGEAEAARIERLVLSLLDAGPLGYEVWHDRWDDEQGEWEEIAPDLPPGEEAEEPEPAEPAAEPVGPPAEPVEEAPASAGFPGAAASLRDAAALVLVSFADREGAAELRARLAEAGIQTVSRRRGVGIPAVDETAAAELVASLRGQLPAGARVETTRLPRRRRRG